MIQFTCPHCGSQTDADDQFAGRSGPCRTCGATVTIPGTPTQPFATVAPSHSGKWAPALLLGLGCGAVGLVLVVPFLMALLLPAVQQAREAGRRNTCNNNLKQLGIAMHTYADVWGAFPPAYIADENGRPMHSWRVLILPYLDQQSLYDRYNFDEPWDGPSNSQLASHIPAAYHCPSHVAAGRSSAITSYAAISGPGTIFDADTPSTIQSITDGSAMTLMIAEAANAGIHWMEPRDLDFDEMTFHVNGSPNEISSHHTGIVEVLFADGHTSMLDASIGNQVLRAILTKSGGE